MERDSGLSLLDVPLDDVLKTAAFSLMDEEEPHFLQANRLLEQVHPPSLVAFALGR